MQIESLNDLILVASFSSYLDVWSLEMKHLRTIDVTALGLKFLSYEIIHFAPTANQEVIVMTHRGDMVRLNIESSKAKIKPTRISNIIKLPGKQQCISLLEKDEERTVYIGGSDGIVYGLNPCTH